MRVLMFGWEFPPFKSGGLGKACRDLCKGLDSQGVDVSFVMPISPKQTEPTDFAKIIGARRASDLVSIESTSVEIKGITSPLQPYSSPEEYEERTRTQSWEFYEEGSAESSETGTLYGHDLMEEVERYAQMAAQIAEEETFDVIHAHDWMTYRAGLVAREVSGKPLVTHIHATESDRTAGNPTPFIEQRESRGLREADLVIANSEWTKKNVIESYDITEENIRVVHWGIEFEEDDRGSKYSSILNEEHKLVLFLGRITVQKGPDYFIEAASKVLEHEPDTKFIVAGEGDMLPSIVEKAGDLGILEDVIFTGWLEGDEVDRVFQAADLFVMPSVSEPFGLVALEALKNGTPTILSKQSGVSEIINHCMEVDFWDVDLLTDKIVGALRYPAIRQSMKEHGVTEVEELGLEEPARKIIDCYQETLQK